MPRFKVTIERSRGIYNVADHFGRKPINPFSIHDIWNPDLRDHKELRTFEFEAKDEAEVRWYFAEAQKADTEELRGFTLRLIEQEKPNGMG
jgi:hypothetical protein